MCSDCAFKPGSPERMNNPRAVADSDTLDRIVGNGERFWCHNGLRMQTGWRHPSGVEIPIPDESVGAYEPPIIDGVPYKADGTAGDLCAGWTARRLHHIMRGIPK